MHVLRRIRELLELIRFSHTVFALPFALLAALMAWHYRAQQTPPRPWRWIELVGIVLCMVLARSAAMAFNRLADRELDARNPRTATRHLPQGALSVRLVAVFAAVCAAGFVASTLLFLPNGWPLRLAVPVLLFLLGYSYTKRFTVLAHFWLGAALMLAPLCAWIALLGLESLAPAALLGGAVLLWVAGFDIIYACQDAEVDRREGLHSIPARLGIAGGLRLAAVCHAGTLALLAMVPWAYPVAAFGWIYGVGVGLIALLLAYEHLLVRPDDLSRVQVAFFHVNAVVSLGLLGIAALDLWL
jgi:4-hydroxybenzoate polyprenyltransferase